VGSALLPHFEHGLMTASRPAERQPFLSAQNLGGRRSYGNLIWPPAGPLTDPSIGSRQPKKAAMRPAAP